jgi:protein TonB
MRSLDTVRIEQDNTRVLIKAGLIAFFVEFIFLTLVGIQEHWLAHPQKTTGLDESKYIEAEVFQIPEQAHLMEEKKMAAPKAHDISISKTPSKKAPSQALPEEKNQTDEGPKLAANHGPVPMVAPVPVIPDYLKDKDINASVVIEFLVNTQGTAVPRLVDSSGYEELDAIAIETVKKWQFRPAEQNHKPIDAKVRLKINFQVK